MRTIQAQELTQLATSIFLAAGASTDNTHMVVESLVDANLTGHDSHGVLRIPAYVADIRSGSLDAAASPFVVRETASMALVDGARTFGQVAGRYLSDLAVRKARDSGVAIVLARHSHHTGRIGEWVERVAASGLVGMATTSSPPRPGRIVAPFGGAQGALGTNPMAWAMPRSAGAPPVLMDFATSVVAQGKLQVARARGEPLAPNTVLDAAGQPTTNVEDFFAGGLLLPAGGHKGYVLSVIVELLAAGLSFGDDIPPGEASSCLQMLAIDPGVLGSHAAFVAYVDDMAARLKAVPPLPGVAEVLVPGEPEARSRAQRRAEGIPLPDRTWDALQTTAREVGATAELVSN